MVEGIILAAGLSSRAGTYKMTMDIKGKTLLARCIEGMYEACSKIYVVAGYKVCDLFTVIRNYSKCHLVYNKEFNEGMLSSVITGLKASRAERVFLTPGDYPFIQPEIYQRLLETASDIVIPAFKGITGHPVLITRKAVNFLLASPDYLSLRDFIYDWGFTMVDVHSRGILLDIDTPEDINEAINYQG